MKKTKTLLLTILSVLLAVSLCLFACSSPSEPETPSTPEQPNTPHTHNYVKTLDDYTFTYTCSCGDVEKGYRIQFVFEEDGSEADAGISVSWIDDEGAETTLTTNELGYVEATLPNDSYTISIDEDTLPEINGAKYLYNKLTVNTQTNGVGLIIPLIQTHTTLSSETINVSDIDYTCHTIQLNKSYVATINSSTDKAWFSLQNESFGKYTVNATRAIDIDIQIDRFFGSVYYVNPGKDTNVNDSVKNKLTYTVVYTDANQNSLFCLSAPNASSYPIEVIFDVSITYQPEDVSVHTQTMVKPTRFETENHTYVYYTTERGSGTPLEQTEPSLAPVGVAKWPNVEGSIIKDMSEQVYQGISLREDGFYYTNGNQLVFAKLNAPSIFGETTLANYLKDSTYATIYNVAEYNEFKCLIRWDNYFGFVQAYTSLANSDGLYPLTQEMLDYLNLVAQKEQSAVYNLLCTYPTQTLNWTAGEGTESNPYTLALGKQTFGNYSLAIAEGGKVYVQVTGNLDLSLTFNSNVKATINGSNYNGEFYTINGTALIVFETINSSALEFIVNLSEYNDPSILEVGTNEAFAIPNNAQVGYVFTALTSGKYDIYCSSMFVNMTLIQGSNEPLNFTGTITVTLAEDEQITLLVQTEMEEQVDFSIIIEENLQENN